MTREQSELGSAIAQMARRTAWSFNPDHDDSKLVDQFDKMGLIALEIPESLGGQGAGPVETAVAVETLAYALAPMSLFRSQLAVCALVSSPPSAERDDVLRNIVEGEVAITYGQDAETLTRGRSQPIRLDGDTVSGDVVVPAAANGYVVTRITGTSGDQWVLFRLDEGGERRTFQTIDPRHALAVAAVPTGTRWQFLAGDHDRLAPRIHARLASLAAFDLLGSARRAFDLTVAYVKERKQFGQPIGSFQAVQHRLADHAAALALAAANGHWALWAAEHRPSSLRWAGWTALLSAAEASSAIADDTVHLHGAIGTTQEALPHHFVRRALQCKVIFGSPFEWTTSIFVGLQEDPDGAGLDIAGTSRRAGL